MTTPEQEALWLPVAQQILDRWGIKHASLKCTIAMEIAGIVAEKDAEIAKLKAERLELDRRIHNQRVALRQNWEITEMRAQYKRAWYPSKLLMSILRRPRAGHQ